jgi:hypothetical protein
MFRKTFIIIIFAFITFRCNGPDPVSYLMSAEDANLKASLIGGWGVKNNFERYYNSDNTFTDLIYWPNAEGKLALHQKTTGYYYVNNQIIKYYHLNYYFFCKDPEFIDDYFINDQKIQIIDNKMLAKKVFVLSKNGGDNNSLLGDWKMENWTSIWIPGSYDMIYNDYEMRYYTFTKDSVFCKINLFNEHSAPVFYYSSKMIYNPPGLQTFFKIDDYYYYPPSNSFTVEFKNGKMYWYPSGDEKIWERLN